MPFNIVMFKHNIKNGQRMDFMDMVQISVGMRTQKKI